MSLLGSAHRGKVSLPMYNLPEMRSANATFWGALRTELARRGLCDIPEALDFERRPVPDGIEAETLITQVCGYPLQTIYRGQATILAAPVYAAAHCSGAYHVGVFIVHRAYNSRHSNSGMNLPRRSLADIAGGKRFFGSVTETHSQPGNIERVARGEADATCVDCVTYAFFCHHRSELGSLTRVLAVTPPSPSIPFVTSSRAPDELNQCLREALFAVARSNQWADARAGLMLRDIVPIDPSGYRLQLSYEQEAKDLGYPELA
jgi:hypothetical protein